MSASRRRKDDRLFCNQCYGTCAGLVSCQAEELSECSALVPGDELCDGVDNDCDGQTDETWQDADSGGSGLHRFG